MDPTEKDNINKNLVALLETTKLSTTFLAVFEEKDILANADLDLINAKKYEGQQAKVKAFYHIILTRPGAFNVLKYALKKTKQNGALQVLIQEQAHSTCKSKRHQTFLGVPDHIKTFLDGSINLLILCTTDCSLSTQRLQENTSSTIFDDVKTFLGDVPKLLAMNRSEKAIFIMNSGSETDRVLQAAKRLPHKIIVVTSNNIDGAIQDHFTWNDLSPIQQDNIRDELNSLFPNTKITDQTLEKLKHETLVDFLNNKPIQLFTDNIPPELPYYVSRRFVTRCVLTNELFTTDEKPDIFAFIDIEKWKLADYCVATSTSTSRIFLEASTPTCRYVLLENDDDFDKIVKKVNVPVHLIRYENNNFRWLRSERSVEVVQNILATQQQQDILREKEFIEFISTDSKLRQPIIISDTPGMGKSVLLGHIGKLLMKTTDHAVCFLIIGELIKSLKEQVGISKDIQTSFQKYLVNTVCNNIIAKHVLEGKLRSKTMEIDLLLDGFDEIDSNDFEFACRVLKTILGSYSSIRLWVTTRPHLLHLLENTIGVLGHNIQELNFDDQINFLTKYWSQAEKISHEKLESFAKQCLSCLNDNMNSDDKIIAGIPLQCLLIGEVYKDKVKPYCSVTDSGVQKLEMIGSIVNLYQLFIETKIRKFRLCYTKRAVTESEIFKSHIYYSFFVIFPGKDISKAGDNLGTESIDMEQILDVGILELSSTQSLPRFIHRTFAEYFISFHFTNLIKSPVHNSAQNYLFGIIFQTKKSNAKSNQITRAGREFQYNVICYFVDKCIGQAKSIPTRLTKNTLKQVVNASIYHNFPNLFEYLRSIFSIKQNLKLDVLTTKLILLCIEKCSLHFIQLVLECYEKKHGINKLYITLISREKDATFPTHVTPLHVAAKRGSFEIFNYLIAEKNMLFDSYRRENILQFLVIDSLNQAQYVVNDKIQILNRMSSLNIIRPVMNIFELPVFDKRVHVDLIIELLKIDSYKEVYTPCVFRQLLHQSIKYLPPNAFEKLLKFVYERFRQDYSSLVTIFIFKPILPFLLSAIVHHSEPTMGTIQFLKDSVCSGILSGEFKELLNKESTSLLKLTLKRKEKTKYFESLIEMGCSLENWKGKQTPLTFAVACGNLEAVKLMLKHKISGIDEVDKLGKTALHTAAETCQNKDHLEIIRLLLDSGANVLVKDQKGEHLLESLLHSSNFAGTQWYDVLGVILPLYSKPRVEWFKAELIKNKNKLALPGVHLSVELHVKLINLCANVISESKETP